MGHVHNPAVGGLQPMVRPADDHWVTPRPRRAPAPQEDPRRRDRLFAVTWLLAGATGVAVSTTTGFPADRRGAAAALGAATIGVGLVLVACAGRLPRAALLPLELVAQVLVTLFGAVSGSFEVQAGLVTIGYAFGCAFAAYHLSWCEATLHVTATAGLYGLLLVGTTPAAVAQPRWLTATAFLVGLVVVIGRLRDQMQHLLGAVQHESRTDELTGLTNRRGFLEDARRELARAGRTGRPLALLAIDVDHFKRLNDTHGHAAGDTALAALGGLLRDRARSGDLAGRLGGEEFAMLLPDTGPEQAVALADRLRLLVADLPGPQPITVSVGVAAPQHPPDTVERLLRDADDALYRAKSTGRDRVVRAGPPTPLAV